MIRDIWKENYRLMKIHKNYIDKESFILNYYYHNDISYYNYELRRIKMSK